MGRLYLVGVVIAGVAALYMGLYVASDRGFGISLFLNLAWWVTTEMAYVAVMRRQFAAHREWMIRSYVVTFAFVLFRLMAFDLNWLSSLGAEMQPVVLVWIAWTVPMLVAQVVLEWQRTVGAKRTSASPLRRPSVVEPATATNV